MTKISNLYALTNYITANTSGNVVIAAPSSGYALDVTGTGRYTGALTANSFVKSGGTAAQILAADGSVITAGTNITISGGVISASGGGGAYLPLSGGTLTGALNGTSIALSSTLSINGGILTGNNIVSMRANPTGGQFRIEKSDGSLSAYPFYVGVDGTALAYYYNTAGLLKVLLHTDGTSYFGNNLSVGYSSYSATTYTLDVNGTSNIVGASRFLSTVTLTGGNEQRFYRADNAIYTRLYDAGSTFTLDNRNGNGFSFQSAGSNQFIINSDGAMGFNYPILGSRSFMFRGVAGRVLVIEAAEAGGIHSIYLRPNSTGRHLISSNYLSGGVYLPLALSGRENDSDFVLGTNGNVGIGTTNPLSLLHVAGNILSQGLRLNISTANQGHRFYSRTMDVSAYTTQTNMRFAVTGGNNVQFQYEIVFHATRLSGTLAEIWYLRYTAGIAYDTAGNPNERWWDLREQAGNGIAGVGRSNNTGYFDITNSAFDTSCRLTCVVKITCSNWDAVTVTFP
jgi:hypothetical protein